MGLYNGAMRAHALAEITEDHAAAPLPDYQGGGIVNLMASIAGAFGGDPRSYPPLDVLGRGWLRAHRNIVLVVIDGLGYEWLKRAGPGSARPRSTTALGSAA